MAKSKDLKDYKGWTIIKSWNTDFRGNIIKDSIIYEAEKDNCVISYSRSLSELKNIINNR